MTNKPTLIIGCSDKKQFTADTAFNFYTGAMFSLIRANIKRPLAEFNILILSAKHGLIEASRVISPYNQRMPSKAKKNDITAFAELHGKAASELLCRYSAHEGGLFVVLSNDYLAAYDAMGAQNKFKDAIKGFGSVYVSRNHRGIGELRGRLKKILQLTQQASNAPTLFRSGLASDDELVGFSKAGCDLGASLAYISDVKSPHRLNYLKQAMMNDKKVFLDNGMITEISRGNFISPKDVFARYISIVKSLKPSVAKHLSIVIPDDPFCENNSLNIVTTHKSDIKWLAKKVNVILPFHNNPKIREHVIAMMSALDNISGLCAGIPCKETIKTETGPHELRMPISDIETIFSLKNKKGTPVFTKAHFLALSEVTRGKIFQNRLMLCDLYSITMSCDACRTTAVMGNNMRSKRKGSVALRAITSSKTKANVTKSLQYLAYNMDDEWDYPYIHERIMESISDNVENFVLIWNTVMSGCWAINIDEMEQDDASNFCRDVICAFPRYLEHEIVDAFKAIFWEEFERNVHKPSAFDVRAETFTHIFRCSTKDHVQLEMMV